MDVWTYIAFRPPHVFTSEPESRNRIRYNDPFGPSAVRSRISVSPDDQCAFMNRLLGLVAPIPPPPRSAVLLGAALLLAVVGAAGPSSAHGQADTTGVAPDTAAVAPADTVRAGPDSTAAARPDTAAVPDDPRRFRAPAYGRPPIDSLPVLTPLVGVEHIVAQQPGSFLYDLGAVGWPHGWSASGLGPHRSRLWLDGHSYNSPLTGRARFDLLPPSFLKRPGTGVDPGGGGVGVHASWRDYDSLRPITEIRYRRDSNGQQAIEVAHSQKHQLSLFGAPGIFQATLGYGGRATDGAYVGSDLRRERRIWGRLRYQRDEWAVELSDLSARHRIGAHSGVVPPAGSPFGAIYFLPRCEACSQGTEARRRTFRNDLTARARVPLLPGLDAPTTLSATWTSNTFDFAPSAADTTWTVRMNGGHGQVRQSFALGPHALNVEARGSLWGVGDSNVLAAGATRWSAHALARDSVRVGGTSLVADLGWHATSDQQYPSASLQLERPLGPVQGSASIAATGQRLSWFETAGFPGFVEPLPRASPALFGRVLRGRVGLEAQLGTLDLGLEAFAHQVRDAVDLYAPPVAPEQRLASADSVTARATATPVRRAGATMTFGWRRDADRGLYLSGSATALRTLSAGASERQTRLARTLPTVYGRGRIGARFVFFVDLITDLYVQARGWTGMNSRWFHPATGRLVVPPANTPVPSRGAGVQAGPSGTVDVHAEIKLRGATLFFTFENVQSTFAPAGSVQRQTALVPGTFVVPVYPLPARQFRFGVHWPIFD